MNAVGVKGNVGKNLLFPPQGSPQVRGPRSGSITLPLTSCLTGFSCMTTDNFCFYLQNRLIQTSKTGGQWYSSPFSIPWFNKPASGIEPLTLKS